MRFQEKNFGLNLYQAKSGVILFWMGRQLGSPKKKFWSEFASKSNLVLSHFGWVDSPKKNFLVPTCSKPNLVLSPFRGWGGGGGGLHVATTNQPTVPTY